MNSEEQQKSIIIFDTNFIIEHKNSLQKIIMELSERHILYVTQISIKERIGQKYLEILDIYTKFENLKEEFGSYFEILERNTFIDKVEEMSKETSDVYKEQFSRHIINFNCNENIFEEVLERAFKKTPPFSPIRKSSDKGFKDTLLWISLIDFFEKHRGPETIYLLTDDKIFLENADELESEFIGRTKRNIKIEKNNHYKVLLGEEESLKNGTLEIERLSPDKIKELRRVLSSAMENICFTRVDYNYDTAFEKRFTIKQKVEPNDMLQVLDLLGNFISNHLFDENISFSDLLEDTDIVVEDHYFVPIEEIEKLYSLYKLIKADYNEYLIPYLNTVCAKINENYEVPLTDDDVPF